LHQKKYLNLSIYFVLFIFGITACTNAPIKRRGSGYSKRSNYSSKNRGNLFSPIKKKVALLEIYNESPFGKQDLAITATEELRREVSKTSDFVIDPEASALFGSSKEIYAGGGLKLAQLSRKAKLSGVNLVIFGRITHARVRQKADEIGFVRKTKSYAESVVEIRVFDVLANKEIFTDKMDGNINDSSFRFFMSQRDAHVDYRRGLLRYSVKIAIKRFTPKLSKLGQKLDWTGRVAKIIGSKIYLNAGRRSGLNLGDILKVMTEGQEIFDPESGALLGVSKGQVKGTLEVIDYFGPDGTVSILHSGGSVTEGDFVQLY
jgi:hypothetical protein